MIAVKLQGRLGNQLFQYAFIYSTAKRLKTKFYIDKRDYNFIASEYFNIKNDFLWPLDKRLFSITGYKNLFSLYIKRRLYRTFEQVLFNGKKLIIDNHRLVQEGLDQIKNGYIFEGYFQSEKYFENHVAEIRQLLSVKNKYIEAFNRLLENLPVSKRKIVVHIRRGDYLELNMALPVTYYKKALTETYDKDSLCIFVSDDPEFVEKEFDFINSKYISNNVDIVDLQFLINADVCILSCSSFSWWGAWLNNDPNKVIYAPKNWIGFEKGIEYPVGIAENMNFNWISL